MPNKKGTKPLSHYAVSIDSIEKVTGIDFFPILQDEMENKLESKNSIKGWFENSSINYKIDQFIT